MKKPPLTINLQEEIEDNKCIVAELMRRAMSAWERGDFAGRVSFLIRAENHIDYINVLRALQVKQSKKGADNGSIDG
jgi:hypothetical protein